MSTLFLAITSIIPLLILISLLLSAKTGGWQKEELGPVDRSWGDKGSSQGLWAWGLSLLLSAKTGGWREEKLGPVDRSWGDKGSSQGFWARC